MQLPGFALDSMAEAAANGDASTGATVPASSNPDTTHEQEPGDAENLPRAVESDPSRRYTRVG